MAVTWPSFASSAADYRQHAAELREMVAIEKNRELDWKLLNVAEGYDALAVLAEIVMAAGSDQRSQPHRALH